MITEWVLAVVFIAAVVFLLLWLWEKDVVAELEARLQWARKDLKDTTSERDQAADYIRKTSATVEKLTKDRDEWKRAAIHNAVELDKANSRLHKVHKALEGQ